MAKRKQHDDKLVTAYYKVIEFYEENKKHVYIALGIIVLAVAGIVGFVNQKKENNETAALELAKIKPVYEAGNYVQAVSGDSAGVSKGLLFIAENYGSTDSGELAKLMLANSFFQLRDFDNAEKWYKAYSGNIEILNVASEAGIAAVYEAKKNFGDAAKAFEKAYNEDEKNPFRDEYLYYAGKNYFMAKDMENAKRVFQELKSEFPKSKYIAQAERYNAVMSN